MTPNLRKIRNCKVLEVLLPGFGNAISGSSLPLIRLDARLCYQLLDGGKFFLYPFR
jgi:hypothetical protein